MSATTCLREAGDLVCHDWNLAGTAPASCGAAGAEIAYDFAYNGVGQLVSETVSDPLLRWSPAANVSDAYTANGLNQYAQIATTDAGGTASVAPAYDGNGNVTTDHRGRAYVYSAENQLYTVREAGTNALLAQNVYYADGTRRLLNSDSGGIRRFYYDGDQEIEETGNLATDLRRRYVRLPGSVDEPMLMIDYTLSAVCTTAAGGALPCERWAHQNRLGSVVAVTNSSGAVVEKYKYGPYGELTGEPAGGFPFRFTGQKLDPETGLYYYKARFYDPETGRFLQTDPIGYRDQMNLYAYTYNDPINGYDPSGESAASATCRSSAATCRAAPNPYVKGASCAVAAVSCSIAATEKIPAVYTKKEPLLEVGKDGKVHGDLPTPDAWDDATDEVIEIDTQALNDSIEVRLEERRQRQENNEPTDKEHDERIAREEDLRRSLEKRLEDRNGK